MLTLGLGRDVVEGGALHGTVTCPSASCRARSASRWPASGCSTAALATATPQVTASTPGATIRQRVDQAADQCVAGADRVAHLDHRRGHPVALALGDVRRTGRAGGDQGPQRTALPQSVGHQEGTGLDLVEGCVVVRRLVGPATQRAFCLVQVGGHQVRSRRQCLHQRLARSVDDRKRTVLASEGGQPSVQIGRQARRQASAADQDPRAGRRDLGQFAGGQLEEGIGLLGAHGRARFVEHAGPATRLEDDRRLADLSGHRHAAQPQPLGAAQRAEPVRVVDAHQPQQLGLAAQVGDRAADVHALAADGQHRVVRPHHRTRLEPLDPQRAVEAEVGGDDEHAGLLGSLWGMVSVT